jgi:hypothetical protein
MFLPQAILGRHYLPSFHKGRSSVPYAEGDAKGSKILEYFRVISVRTFLPTQKALWVLGSGLF